MLLVKSTVLGLVNFYHRFLLNCADTLQPLNELLSTSKGNTKTVLWSENGSAAFATIKEALANTSLLSHPKPDVPTSIMTDASDIAVGAVLQQHIGNDWHPISYFSKKLKPAESQKLMKFTLGSGLREITNDLHFLLEWADTFAVHLVPQKL